MENCVYRIINKINNKVYIGSTIDSERRKIEHFNQLNRGSHNIIDAGCEVQKEVYDMFK